MKKLLLLSLLLIPIFCFGQKHKKEDILKIQKDTIENWMNTEYFKIDSSNIVVSKIINDIQGTKDELYIRVKNFFTRYYNDANSIIQTDDKESGTIIGKGFNKISYFGFSRTTFADISSPFMGTVNFNYYHILRVDIKDNRIRIICSVNEMEEDIKKHYFNTKQEVNSSDSYRIADYPPFTNKRDDNIDKSEETLTSVFTELIEKMHITIDTVEKTIKEGAIKGENDDW